MIYESGNNNVRLGFTLVEVLITVAILSTAIIFVFRSFTVLLSSVKFSQDLNLACFLAEGKMWEIENKQKYISSVLEPGQGVERIQGKDFTWRYGLGKLDNSDLIEMDCSIFWQENGREEEYSLEFLTYLLPKG